MHLVCPSLHSRSPRQHVLSLSGNYSQSTQKNHTNQAPSLLAAFGLDSSYCHFFLKTIPHLYFEDI